MSLQLRLLNFAARTFMQPKVVRAAPLTLRADLDRMGPPYDADDGRHAALRHGMAVEDHFLF